MALPVACTNTELAESCSPLLTLKNLIIEKFMNIEGRHKAEACREIHIMNLI